jgi:DnaJ-class molecular chaperone
MSFFSGPCPECDEPGGEILSGNGKCNACGGTGTIGVFEAMESLIQGGDSDCERCDGTGHCPRCGGTGRIE